MASAQAVGPRADRGVYESLHTAVGAAIKLRPPNANAVSGDRNDSCVCVYCLVLSEMVSFTTFFSDNSTSSAEASWLRDNLLPEISNPLTENA